MTSLTQVEVSKPGLMLINNGIGFLLVGVVTCNVRGELQRTVSALTHWHKAVPVAASAIISIGISYFGLWLQQLVTATSFMVFGAFNKVIVILVGILYYHDTHRPDAMLGAIISMLGILAYGSIHKGY